MDKTLNQTYRDRKYFRFSSTKIALYLINVMLYRPILTMDAGLPFELGVGLRTPGGLFLGVWYARGIDFRRKPAEQRKHTSK